MNQLLMISIKLMCFAVVLINAGTSLFGRPGAAGMDVVAMTNSTQLKPFVSRMDNVEVSVDLAGNILWLSAAQDQLILQTDTGMLWVKNLHDQTALQFGQHVRLTGHGMAGQGFLDQALIDNNGFHSALEKSGTVYLTAGRHPIRAEWFNGPSDYMFNLEYAGPGIERQRIPDKLLYQMETNGVVDDVLVPGLNFNCYEAILDRLPQRREFVAVKTGNVINFDIGVRTRNQDVALDFTGYLQVDRDGLYTFWSKSDDGSRLFVESSPLHIEVLDSTSLPEPRVIEPGQVLNPEEDCFWAVTEGVVTGVHIDTGGAFQVELCGDSKYMYLILDAADFHPPGLFSRIRAKGICLRTREAKGGYVAGRLLMSSASHVEELLPAPVPTGNFATTLAELRRRAADSQRTASLLCLTGTVVTAVSPRGFFAFQDETGGVIVQMNRQTDWVRPGQLITLKGNGVLDGNKLILNHAALVDNDGLHTTSEKSGAVYLAAGRHPIHVSWFNRTGTTGLNVYYQGPDLSRTTIPDSALMRPQIDPASGDIKWVNGLNYTCYNGEWGKVPRVEGLEPVAMGDATNFDLRVANRTEKVGLEFNGFLNVERDGPYFISDLSDDGSLLFIDEQVLQIQQISTNSLPDPLHIFPRQILGSDQNHRWSQTEGTVNFISESAGSLFLELDSIYGPMSVEVADDSDGVPSLILGSSSAGARILPECHGT